MRHRLSLHGWPLLVVALVCACDDDKTPGATGGSGGTSSQDSGTTTTGGRAGNGGSAGSTGGGTGGINPADGGLAPCLDLPTDLDRPPAGRLPCDLLPPGFVAP
jgi:hypothetical protein